jgi:hypothetical protein
VRRSFQLRQTDFADELCACGGRASRETVSHWENVDPEGRPRSRMTRRNAEALVALAESRGVSLPLELFIEWSEPPLQTLARQQAELSAQVAELHEMVKTLLGALSADRQSRLRVM